MPTHMNQYWISISLIYSLGISVSCVSKSYVRQQVTPIIEKVNLGEGTAKKASKIKEVDTGVQHNLEVQSARDDRVAYLVDSAAQKAAKAQQTGEDAARRVADLASAIAKYDDYQVVNQVSVYFDLGKDTLGMDSERKLDDLGFQFSNVQNYIITVEGGTDSLGNQEHNHDLSSRRADMVRQYLTAKCHLPSFRIHTIGLGADRPIASNDTASGRAQNRRANIQIWTGPGATERVKPKSGASTDDGYDRESAR
jgi:outer membrane protein OmpA-like peptidoglycan-associated protein